MKSNKIKENNRNNKFYKLDPSGISLIVLVITIIVIIILATVVILTLNKNNPIEEANRARYESDVVNIQAIFTNTVAKVMAQNQGIIEVNPGELNSVKIVENGVSSVEGRVNYTVNNPENNANENGIIIFNTGTNSSTTYYTGKKLPLYSSGETIWYVDSEGVISLKIDEQEYGVGEKTEGSAGEIDGEEIAYSENPMMKGGRLLSMIGQDYRGKITKIKFAVNVKVPNTKVEAWDISEANDKSVITWIEDDGADGYILTIAGKEKIIANSSCPLFQDLYNVTQIENLQLLDTSKIVNASYMFAGLRKITEINLENMDMSNVTNMEWMFYNDTELKKVILKNMNTNKLEKTNCMFLYCLCLEALDLSNFDTSNVTDMSSMFRNCYNIKNINFGGLFNTSKVTNMEQMFWDCRGVVNLDLTNFDTSNVTNMKGMFLDCSNLENLDISSFDTGNVTDMSSMFKNCNRLISLDLGNFNTNNVTNMSYMFYCCNNLTTTIDIRGKEKLYYYYTNMFEFSARFSPAKIIVNYTVDTLDLVDSMIATKSYDSNVEKGIQI